jgi:HAMP domain-containing protein
MVQRQYRMASRDGLSRDEVRWLASRVNQIRQQLRMERADWDRDRW